MIHVKEIVNLTGEELEIRDYKTYECIIIPKAIDTVNRPSQDDTLEYDGIELPIYDGNKTYDLPEVEGTIYIVKEKVKSHYMERKDVFIIRQCDRNKHHPTILNSLQN